jgi:RNA polymerase-binding transcription factor DksA
MTRYAELAQLLGERRRQLQGEVRSGIREGRDERAKRVGDIVEDSEVRYGSCVTCGGDISPRCLRALPFAVRCQFCEARCEAGSPGFPRTERRESQPAFPDMLAP